MFVGRESVEGSIDLLELRPILLKCGLVEQFFARISPAN
jgi:hypothetical protein